ncbi:IclR family transcriptional regulator [Oceanobacillus luteolus]|uniref:IclR family transcriptional regulator n=1 Tax=Oceanobacillus luteolus TaxID=1274358 RepID=A0ABW4HP85_9BACI
MSRSLVKAIQVLDCFLEKPVMTINELAEIAAMPKTTVFRLAGGLEEAGLLIKDRKSSHDVTYRMSLKLLEYGKFVSDQLEYSKVARPHMKKLNEEIDELVHLTIMEGYEAVYVETVNSSKPVRLVGKVGARAPLYAGSAPKLLLSGLDDDEVESYLNHVEFNKFTPNTLDEKEKIKEELEKIRERGYSISYSEHYQATIGMSYPIYDYEGKMIAAMGVSIPYIDHSKTRETFILSKLERTVMDIWKELGYTGVHPS